MTAKKPSAKTAKPKASTARDVQVQIHTRGDKALTARQQARLDAMEARDAEIKAVLRVWMNDLVSVAHKLKAAKAKYREEIRQVLDEIYSKYVEIEHSEFRADFYRELRIRMLDAGYKIQVNTPDVGLMIRLVWSNNAISAARVHQYSRIFHNAISSSVTAEGFRDWIQERTFAEAAEEQKRKELQSELEEVRKERIKRARIVVLNYLDWRETHPILFGEKRMLAHKANKYVTPNTHLIVMLGTAVRRYDRESDYADIYVSHILPP